MSDEQRKYIDVDADGDSDVSDDQRKANQEQRRTALTHAQRQARYRARKEQDRSEEYKRRTAQRAQTDRAAEYNLRNLERNPAMQIAKLRARINQDNAATEAEHQAHMQAAAAVFASGHAELEEPAPPEQQEGETDKEFEKKMHKHHSARIAMDAAWRMWGSNAPAPSACEPPKHMTEEEIEAYVDEFTDTVHNANVVKCAWCAELRVEAAEQFPPDEDELPPRTYHITDERLKPAARRRPASEDPAHDERDARGFIKALVIDNTWITVCSRCDTLIAHGRSREVWQTAFDFGAIDSSLRNLSDAERAFIALYHPFQKIVKVQLRHNNGVVTGARGHAITFAQDSMEKLALHVSRMKAQASRIALPTCRLRDIVGLHFIGPRGEATTVGGALQRGIMNASPAKILDAVRYLEQSHPLYRGKVSLDPHYNFDRDMCDVESIITDTGAGGANQHVAHRAAARAAAADDDDTERNEDDALPENFQFSIESDVVVERKRDAHQADEREVLQWVVQQKDRALNEFTENVALFGGSFPHLLPTNGFPSNGYPADKVARHMLDYYDGRFQSEANFLHLLDSQRIRHKALRNAAQTPPEYAREVAFELNKPEFAADLKLALEARDNGTITKRQSEMLHFVRAAIRIPLRNVAFTEGDRAAGLWHIMSLNRCHGPPSFFLTLAPSMMQNKLGVKLALATNEHIRRVGGGMTDAMCMAAVMRSPASSSLFYQHFIEEVVTKLLGVPLGEKTSTGSDHAPGALGVVRAYFGTTECQAMGLLHFHVLVWTKFTPAHTMELARAGRLDEAASAIEAQMRTTMPPEYHAWREKRLVNNIRILTADEGRNVTAEKKFWRAVAHTQHHDEHRPTCKKNKAAARQQQSPLVLCRLGFPRPASETTKLLMFLSVPQAARAKWEEGVNYLTISPSDAPDVVPCQHHCCFCNVLQYRPTPPLRFVERRPHRQVTVTSTRLAVQRTMRLLRDTTLSEFNEAILRATQCSCNMAMLHSVEEAMSAEGYIGEKATNGEGQFSVATATMLASAASSITEARSERFNNRIIGRFAMAATSAREVPSTMAAHAIRGGTRYTTNATFANINGHEIVRTVPEDVRRRMIEAERQRLQQNPHTDAAEPGGEENEVVQDDDAPHLDVEEADQDALDDERNVDRQERLFIQRDYRSKQFVLTNQWKDYKFRPAECDEMNAIEFFCCTREVPANADAVEDARLAAQVAAGAPESSDDEDDSLGRNANPRWRYAKDHPRVSTVLRMLRSRMATPALNGARPPPLPQNMEARRPETAEMCQVWAWFWKALLVPWRDENEWRDATFDWMQRMINNLARSIESHNRAAAWFCIRCTWGNATTTMNKRLFNSWRFSNADVVAQQTSQPKKKPAEDDVQQFERIWTHLQNLSGGDEDTAEAVASRRERLKQRFAAVSAPPQGTAAGAVPVNAPPPPPQIRRIRIPGSIARADQGAMEELNRTIAALRDYKLAVAGTSTAAAARVQQRQLPDTCAGHERFETLNAEQRAFVERTLRAIKASTESGAEPELFWLDGAAGSGKTYATRILIDTIRRVHGHASVLACAYQGTAAVNLEIGARTIHSAFSVEVGTKNRSSGAPVLQSEFPALKLLVIEEVSMVDAALFSLIELKMRDAYQVARPFAGVTVLAVGDFLQIPPQIGKSLAHAALLAREGGVRMENDAVLGGMLWRGAVRVRLLRDMRAAGCGVQLERVNSMRTQKRFTRDMMQSIRELRYTTFRDEPAWASAKSLHATNEAKNAAGEAQMQRAADANGTFIYRWRIELPTSVARMNLPLEKIEELYDKTPELWQDFQAGVEYMVLSNFCTQLGITNGAMGRAVKLHVAPMDALRVQQAEIAAAEMGSAVVHLSFRPLAVELEFDIPPTLTASDIVRLHLGRVVGGRWVVPFVQKTIDPVELTDSLKISRKGFDIVQGFALTMHKSQGHSLEPLVLDLARPTSVRRSNLTFEMLYVALSRARSDRGLRRFPVAHGETVEYLYALRPHRHTVEYLDERFWKDESGAQAERRRFLEPVPQQRRAPPTAMESRQRAARPAAAARPWNSAAADERGAAQAPIEEPPARTPWYKMIPVRPARRARSQHTSDDEDNNNNNNTSESE